MKILSINIFLTIILTTNISWTMQTIKVIDLTPDQLALMQPVKIANLLVGLVSTKKIPELNHLLEIGADPNRRNEQGILPLGHAAMEGNYDMVKMLLEAKVKASPNLINLFGQTALLLAVFNERPRIVQLLLNYKADPLIHVGFNNDAYSTSIDIAKATGNVLSLKILLRHYLTKHLGKPFALASSQELQNVFNKEIEKEELFYELIRKIKSEATKEKPMFLRLSNELDAKNVEALNINLEDPQLRTYQEIYEQKVKSKGSVLQQLRQREMSGKLCMPPPKDIQTNE